jgi:hypothetical protein
MQVIETKPYIKSLPGIGRKSKKELAIAIVI